MLCGCQEVGLDGEPASAQAGPAVEMPEGRPYPPLQTVPPRPQLSYTVQQQRQIVDALIADRENARYTSEVIRYRSGLSSLPPPPTPPAPAPEVKIEPALASKAGPEQPALTKQETLVDFLGELSRRFWSDPPESAAPDDGDASDDTEAAPSPEPKKQGSEDPAPAPAAAGQPPAGGTIARAPLPPARSAVAARLAARPSVVDQVVNPSVAQAPLPPAQPALAARVAAADRGDAEPPQAPLPAPRPVVSSAADIALPVPRPAAVSFPAPPPIKPQRPAATSTDRAALPSLVTRTAS